MEKELCIVHANCQGEPLLERLTACPEFHARYECLLYTNYVHEPVPDYALNNCSLFLYQHLGDKWGELASDALLANLPQSTRSLCIPNMFFKGYWPTWSNEPGFDYRCVLLDELIETALPVEEVILLYMHTDVSTRFDLLSLVTETIATERERETHTPIKYLDVITKNYRETQLFHTVNHPGSLLMNHVATGILEALGFTPPAPSVFDALPEPFAEFDQPINPKVAEFFGWDFVETDRLYTIYGRKMNFARWVSSYVFARRAGISDFIGFLQGDYIEI
ncbi:WcbI family polysaccharide biosynthesis putative acetyltransferase [Pseudodesulfovibrio sediminis]|uniref:Polysaccharide biosynthesis enzyme WcbI domain-containing protein n=1 Tax=Pseudodesulfovibrio sediminis TaxID=2810563 RepID=A0ABN6EWV0_9BACT|nr:WcbI family polysaccharide biosynthesis putative acetyltransferase [Pseudodesulfovibrio sediminis]BCS89654.1 hypothetical protein PSDVSF_28960 [Pseudodesulfovibrio sediminis]